MSKLSKLPQITIFFWIMKICATTLGETAGDAFSMSMNLGYLVSTGIFAVIVVAAVALQIRAKGYNPFLYWFTIIATTTVGTTLADFATRSLGIGYTGGSTILLILVIASLAVWRYAMGSVSVDNITTAKGEIFYWTTIIFSQTLGTALGDWFADTADFGYLGAAAIFGGVLLILVALYYFTSISRVILFWLAFIMTRPLGAVVGDFLDKPLDDGGLNLSRYVASLILVAVITACIFIFPQKASEEAH
ncbi:MAG TPA: hypothetical protein PKY59_11600 [Pyrinomonadaceae bacterium]|nr:hypothetical protein [Pyrinomonadaceae bacterium]